MTNSIRKYTARIHPSTCLPLTVGMLLTGCTPATAPLSTLDAQHSEVPCNEQNTVCLPPPACDQTMVVAHHTEANPPVPAGFVRNNLYPVATLNGLTGKVNSSILARMEQTFILKKTSGPLTLSELEQISTTHNYTKVEYNCGITAMTGGSGPPTTGMNAWHHKQTGASVVTPAVLASLGGSGVAPVRVAVLDSGIDPVAGPNPTLGWSYYAASGSLPAHLEDVSGHGTAVGSILKDVGGTAVDMISVRVLDAGGKGDQVGLARGVAWSVANDAQLLNLSLGFPQDTDPAGRLHEYLVDAFAASWSAGSRVYAAAGNLCMGPGGTDCDNFLPAAAPTSVAGDTLAITSVSGLNAEGIPSSQVSNGGVDVWAPSEFICAQTSPPASGSGFYMLSGSSFAVPQVTGGLALLMAAQAQHLSKPKLNLTEVDALRAQLANGSPLPAGAPCATGTRLDLCKTLGWVTGTAPLCLGWTSTAAPETDNCPWSGPPPTLISTFYTPYSGPGPAGYQAGSVLPRDLDNQEDASWCARLSGSSGRAVCTSCEIEFTSSGGSYPGFTLSMNLPAIVGTYNSWQLKLVTGSNVQYVPLPSMPSTPGTATYTGSFSSGAPLTTLPDEAWLMAEDGILHNWNGAPLLIR